MCQFHPPTSRSRCAPNKLRFHRPGPRTCVPPQQISGLRFSQGPMTRSEWEWFCPKPYRHLTARIGCPPNRLQSHHPGWRTCGPSLKQCILRSFQFQGNPSVSEPFDLSSSHLPTPRWYSSPNRPRCHHRGSHKCASRWRKLRPRSFPSQATTFVSV